MGCFLPKGRLISLNYLLIDSKYFQLLLYPLLPTLFLPHVYFPVFAKSSTQMKD